MGFGAGLSGVVGVVFIIGFSDGQWVDFVGLSDGIGVEAINGCAVGAKTGRVVGHFTGCFACGASVRYLVGLLVGLGCFACGASVGNLVGLLVGRAVGLLLGAFAAKVFVKT